jgi:hypothetical protein
MIGGEPDETINHWSREEYLKYGEKSKQGKLCGKSRKPKAQTRGREASSSRKHSDQALRWYLQRMRVQGEHNVFLAIERLQLQAHFEQLRSRLRGRHNGKSPSR